jgi:hypothetical protein
MCETVVILSHLSTDPTDFVYHGQLKRGIFVFCRGNKSVQFSDDATY